MTMAADTGGFPEYPSLSPEVLDLIDEGVCAVDGALRVTYANSSVERFFGRPRSDIIGRPLREAGPGFDDDGLLRALGQKIHHPVGPPIDLTANLAGVRTEVRIHRQTAGLWLFFRDLSARQAMERELAERDQILTMAERSAGIGVWDIDLATETVRGTPQFWRVMGLPPTQEPLPIETTRRLRLPEDRERVAQGFQAVVSNHAETFEMEYRIQRPDGQIRWIFGRGRVIRDAAGRPVRYTGIDIDVTERKAAEAVLADMNQVLENRVRERTAELEAEIARRAEAEERLHHAQKMETIGQLTGGIAHDFNNLLTVISGNIEAMERYVPAAEPRLRRFIEAALRGSERAATLTNRLLAFARRQALEPKLLEANQLLLGMSDLLHRTLGERIAVRMELADDPCSIIADPNQLESAVLNLVVNARDAMPDGGALKIETANAAFDSPVAGGGAGRFAKISISDSGSGMAEAIRQRAFEPFFTTKQLGEGTGLGLAQVYGFVKQSGGHCRLDSEPGEGTTVILYFPAAESQEPPTETNEKRRAILSRGRGEIILVTEDDPDVRAYGADLLHELGYQVLTAADASTALQVLEQNSQVRLLFADVGLPGPMNGRQLAETAIARYPNLRVLLTTGYAEDAVVRRGWLDPAMELIPKPFSSAMLSAKIRAVLQR